MDKKKVKELVEKGISYLNRRYYIASYEQSAMECFKEAIQELSKSDWISVEDRLPEYREKVFVTNKEHKDFVWISHRDNGDTPKRLDDNGFPTWQHHYPYYTVTHWKPIEKLEQ